MPEFNTMEDELWQKELDDYVRQVHFILEGMHVLAVTSGGKAYAFSKAGNSCLFSRQLHDAAIISSAVSQQHNLLATGGEDGKFLITSLDTGKILYGFEAPGKWIEHIVCSPDGNFFAFSCDKKVRIITAAGKLYDSIRLNENTISAIAFHQDGETLAIGRFGGVVLYDMPAKEIYQHLPWKNAVVSLTISRDKKFVCCGTQDYQVHIWPLPFIPESDLAMSGFPNKVKHLHWHCNGSWLATNSGKFTVVWDFSDPGPANRNPVTLEGHFFNVTALAFQHWNDILVSGDEGGLLFFFNTTVSNQSGEIINISEPVTTLCWSNDDKTVAVGTAAGGLFMVQCPIEIK